MKSSLSMAKNLPISMMAEIWPSAKKVLTEFKKLTGDSVIWDHGQRMWRFREKHDEPGRQQY
jgi:hypothetical protein